MHAARISLAIAALLLAAACGDSPDVVAPEGNLKSGTWIGSGNSVATEPGEGGIGQVGSGNVVATGEGPGQIGSGNSIADPTITAERGGAGLIGSGNSATPDSAFSAERGIGQCSSDRAISTQLRKKGSRDVSRSRRDADAARLRPVHSVNLASRPYSAAPGGGPRPHLPTRDIRAPGGAPRPPQCHRFRT